MFGCLRSCLGKVVALVVLVGVAYAGWKWGPAVFPTVERYLAGEETMPEVEATPELAEATLDRFERFRTEGSSDRLLLGEAELSSLVRYALPGILPAGIADPTIRLSEGGLTLTARVATEAFPELPSLREVLGMLPDTVRVRIRGRLEPFDEQWQTLRVEGIEASRIPLPARFTPEILRALGRRDREGLAPDAMLIPLPEGLRAAMVVRDSLVLVADR